METDKFLSRHVGPRLSDIDQMLSTIGVSSMDELIERSIPSNIMHEKALNISKSMTEYEYLNFIKALAAKNKIFKTYIGLGYYNTITPSVILRNIFENASWYTSYTPYQAEISQGRLEALLNFQTMVCSLTAMPIANCSLLDEATAAAEAVIMMFNKRDRSFVKNQGNILFVDKHTFPQTIDVLKTRAKYLEIEVLVGDYKTFEFNDKTFGALVQYPNAQGNINDYQAFAKKAKANNSMLSVIADIMSLAILTPPGEWGADIVCGTTQRFGIPMGYGGPHAAYFATTDALKRNIPGRIIGVSVDRNGNQALRMALQTREQHIKREKATSNICTAQALLATMAGMYAVYHGPDGIKNIAYRIHALTGMLNEGIKALGITQLNPDFFDTLYIETKLADNIVIEGLAQEINFNPVSEKTLSISLDETSTIDDINAILSIIAKACNKSSQAISFANTIHFDETFLRNSPILEERVFKAYRSETEMMRYIKKLERKDISLTHSMISLGSCTMKLNPATTMLPLSWPEFGAIHPFVPKDQALAYQQIISELATDLAEITGFAACSLQPNSGAAGEYTGLIVISAYHASRGEAHRNVVLIPASAHGTNPASAVMAGGKVVVVACDAKGNVDMADLKTKAETHRTNLHSYMITYPSTHGVFEKSIVEMMDIIHQNGGQVYMDGANMNAQVGLTSPGFIGADVCHLNLHKTFAIPHGGGGPGVGPIGVAKHLVPFLPGHVLVETGGEQAIGAVSAAPYGSAFVLPITYGYIKMLGADGLTEASKMAILNANYMATKLKEHFSILYTSETGFVAHEMILDCRHFRKEYGIETVDIAKRLMDYGFHAPTLSFPVPETLMIEPTESESKEELDRFIEAMASIMEEIIEIKEGKGDPKDNLLKNAPHTALETCDDNWDHPYSRLRAAYPLDWVTFNKFWPACARVDNALGDRNLICTCAPISDYID